MRAEDALAQRGRLSCGDALDDDLIHAADRTYQVRDHPRVHEAAQHFARVAEEYERGRPGYPAEAVEWIADRARLGPGRVVVDLAAGTGKLTRELTRTGAHVVAVEPLAQMRAKLVMAVPDAEVVAGTAEHMGLDSLSAGAVTVAAAFHWFSTQGALAEMARVLEPGGKLFLLWNKRDNSDPIHAAISALLERHRGDTPAHASGRWRGVFESSDLFEADGELVSRNEQVLDAGGLCDRFGSVSFVASLPQAERQVVLSELRSLVPPGGSVRLAYSTEVSCYAKR